MFNEMQENLILQVLLKQYEKQANVLIRGNQQLAALAMLKNKKPKGEHKKLQDAEENKFLNDYISELQGATTKPVKPAGQLSLKRSSIAEEEEEDNTYEYIME